MVAKVVLLFCVQTFLVQSISSQCIGAAYNGIAPWEAAGPLWDAPYAGPWNSPFPYAAELPLARPWAAAPCAAAPLAAEWAGYAPAFAPSNGGGFLITSASPIPVTGLYMTSENIYEGPLAVSGAVPFLGAVALEGALPTAGAGAIAYGCGNGNVAMLTEDIAPYGYGPGIAGYGPLAYEEAIVGPGYGYDRGCGCGGFY